MMPPLIAHLVDVAFQLRADVPMAVTPAEKAAVVDYVRVVAVGEPLWYLAGGALA